MLDKARAHRKKQAPRTRSEELPLLDTKAAVDLVQSLKSRLPEWREQLGPFLRKAREKIDDAYSAAAQVLAEQKEAFEDRLAERKTRSGSAARPARSRPASSRTVRKKSH